MTANLLPWEKPLNVKLPEAATCIGCGRHRRQILDDDGCSDFHLVSELHGIALCWRCSRSDEHDWYHEYLAARAALWATKREEVSDENHHVGSQ